MSRFIKGLPVWSAVSAVILSLLLALPLAAAPADKDSASPEKGAAPEAGVCYYTLKAYVKEGLSDIASCTVFR